MGINGVSNPARGDPFIERPICLLFFLFFGGGVIMELFRLPKHDVLLT